MKQYVRLRDILRISTITIFTVHNRPHIQERPNNGFYSYTVLDPSYFQVDDIHVKTVSFHSTEGNQIISTQQQADEALKGIGKRIMTLT